jgi:chemotaxis protein MotB
MMKRFILIAAVFLMTLFLLFGCASTKKLNTLESDNARITAENENLKQELERANSLLAEQERRLASLEQERELEKAALEKTYDNLISELKREIERGQIQVKQVQDRLQVSIAEQLFFETGKAEIKPAGQAVLRRIGPILKKIPEKNIRVEGHTDTVPIGPSLRPQYPTNWELGAARAVNVARFLIKESGIDPLRLSAVSYGQYRPIATNSTEQGRAKNRRIEIVLIDRDLDLAKKMRQFL